MSSLHTVKKSEGILDKGNSRCKVLKMLKSSLLINDVPMSPFQSHGQQQETTAKLSDIIPNCSNNMVLVH